MADRAEKPSAPPDDDPYVTLGLTKTATEADIKKAHRRLVRLSHPDINPDDPGAEARFLKVTAAHDLLKDPAKRARFDAGEIDAAGQERPQRRYYRDFAGTEGPRQSAGGFAGMDPNDILSEILRQHEAGGAQGFAAAGRDHGYTLKVPFLDAARGGKARIDLPGEGPLEFTIPVGLRDGQTLRLRGKGGIGLGGGPRGDAQVTVMVQSHPLFRRDGDNITITLDEAILGAKVDVPTISGDVVLTIPKRSSSGRTLRLRGRGPGDQLVELRIVVPQAEDPALTGLMETWLKSSHDDPRKAMLEGVPR
jgi:DnaJ-class molecular chaperone